MISAPTKALVVLSGGQDSTTCLAWARASFNEVHCLTFDYGQRHAREINAALVVGRIFNVASHEVLQLGDSILGGRSPLTNKAETLELYENYEKMDAIIGDRVEKTFVPMRNALFLTIAANRAACLDCSTIVTGVCQADNANYPDCTQLFIDKQELTINTALGVSVQDPNYIIIKTPLMKMSKAQSIQLMRDLGHFSALAFTHTAYDGAYPPVGKDHASTLRAKGFLEAGVPDPLVVRAAMEGLMSYPDAPNYNMLTPGVEQLLEGLWSDIDWLKREFKIVSTGARA